MTTSNERMRSELRRIAAISVQGAPTDERSARIASRALREIEGRARYAIDGDPKWLERCAGVELNVSAASEL